MDRCLNRLQNAVAYTGLQTNDPVAYKVDMAAQPVQFLGEGERDRDLVDALLDLIEMRQLARVDVALVGYRNVFDGLLNRSQLAVPAIHARAHFPDI